MQPQGSGEDCCCNGVGGGDRCSCLVFGSSGCGIRVTCAFPRDQWNLPAREPHLIRIVEIDESDQIVSVVVGPTDDFDLIWNPPLGTSGRYRAEVCCQEPIAYEECNWEPIGVVTLSITSESCPLYVGVYACVSSVSSCTGTSPETIKVFGYARSNCKLTSLKVNGVEVLDGTDVYWVTSAGGDGCLAGVTSANCGPSPTGLPWVHPTGLANVRTNLSGPLVNSPAPSQFCVSAADECGNFRECCTAVPCHFQKNYMRVEIPSISTMTHEAHWTRITPPTITSVMNIADCSDNLFTDVCYSEPVTLYVDDIYLTRRLTASIAGGSHFFRRDGGASTFSTCNPQHVLLGTGAIELELEVVGRNLVRHPNWPFTKQLVIAGAGGYSLGYSYPVNFYLHLPWGPAVSGLIGLGGFFIFAVPAEDGSGYFESNTFVKIGGQCSYSGNIVGSILRQNPSNIFPRLSNFVVAGGTEAPACGSLLGSAWEIPAYVVNAAVNYNYGVTIAQGASCGATFLTLVSQSGKITLGHSSENNFNFGSGSLYSTTSSPEGLGTKYSEWVAI